MFLSHFSFPIIYLEVIMHELSADASQQLVCLPPRRLAAMSVLSKARLHEGLIPLRRVLLVVLYDEDMGWSPPWTRLAGYGARRVPWGIRCGGAQDCRFDKNANLRPKPRAVGWRMDSRNRTVLRTARQLRKEIASRRDEPNGAISTQIQLPEFWAAFGPCDIDRIDGDGPELLGEVHTTGQSAEDLMHERRRNHNGLTLYPLPWVSHLWERFRAVFVDLADFPTYQVFRLSDPASDLCGFRAACEFDFFHSRFRGLGCHDKRPVCAPAMSGV